MGSRSIQALAHNAQRAHQEGKLLLVLVEEREITDTRSKEDSLLPDGDEGQGQTRPARHHILKQ